uniref:Uncharacterized protein n=2 Tax=Meloidogyne TaxID=189290 RepID=A0A6V7YB84_MELEN|nr:unnamed protein product [Meloidogyne enterolobii]CAD2208933.1 unnamed protein product [Meloidogyne enterolobii]
MFPKILKCIPAVKGATTLQTTNPVLFLQARGVSRRPHEIGAPPQRHMNFFQHAALFSSLVFLMLSYPTYLLCNLDNLRDLPPQEFSDEVKAELEERRKLRAEGKLNVLVAKT